VRTFNAGAAVRFHKKWCVIESSPRATPRNLPRSTPLPLVKTVKAALDELRMQMLGAQMLFGFQMEAAVPSGFDKVSCTAKRFHSIGSALVIIALVLLAFGIAGDIYVILDRIFANGLFAIAAAATLLLGLLILRYAVPLALRKPAS
jgi:hypothetical protein